MIGDWSGTVNQLTDPYRVSVEGKRGRVGTTSCLDRIRVAGP
ncbi:unnamed protein product [Protopolystoma xenopodis]|uniref:Uncharacterized protein n=1 Tax=Protopolystoma xenopodis TaxID=117903 RepID=A0A448WU07_9PLAT|nr:unnamed protein product [Protopolystoma xenopodis]